MTMSDEIDSTNKFCVTAIRDEVAVLALPGRQLTRTEALNLAAWLVAVADVDDQFNAILSKVYDT